MTKIVPHGCFHFSYSNNPAYGQAIKELKQEGHLATNVTHLQIKYRNNRLEAEHEKLKRIINPGRGFQSMKTAYATIKGFEIMCMFKKRTVQYLDVWQSNGDLVY